MSSPELRSPRGVTAVKSVGIPPDHFEHNMRSSNIASHVYVSPAKTISSPIEQPHVRLGTVGFSVEEDEHGYSKTSTMIRLCNFPDAAFMTVLMAPIF